MGHSCCLQTLPNTFLKSQLCVSLVLFVAGTVAHMNNGTHKPLVYSYSILDLFICLRTPPSQPYLFKLPSQPIFQNCFSSLICQNQVNYNAFHRFQYCTPKNFTIRFIYAGYNNEVHCLRLAKPSIRLLSSLPWLIYCRGRTIALHAGDRDSNFDLCLALLAIEQ